MKILVDQDEVLAEWGKRILEWYNLDKAIEAREQNLPAPRVFTLEDMKHWELKMNLGPGSEVYLRNYMRYPNFYQDLEPVEGAIEGMKALIDAGHEVKIVTSIPKCAGLAYEGKLQWLREYMPFFPLKKFYAVSEKYEVKGDLLLDDGLHNLTPFQSVGVAVAFDRPWNQSWTGPRVKSWPEFVKFVEFAKSIRSHGEPT
jgi:5'-nucleotidase